MELIPVNVDPCGRPVNTVRNPKAHKNYACDKCGGTIKTGERYVRGCTHHRDAKIGRTTAYVRFCEACYWDGREEGDPQ